jgi:Type III restriction enzyme, res subunit
MRGAAFSSVGPCRRWLAEEPRSPAAGRAGRHRPFAISPTEQPTRRYPAAVPGAVDYVAFLRDLQSTAFTELRPAQAEALSTYAAGHADAADVAVELPTGAGKSLMALLIAEAWRQEGHSAIVLSANKTLARQLQAESARLNVEVSLLEGTREAIPPVNVRAIQRKRSIGVMNYWVYFNQNPVIDPCDLLIMDDAHLAEQALHSLYSVEVNRFDHRELFERLVGELALRLPDYPALSAADGGATGGYVGADLITMHDQHAVGEVVTAVIEGSPLPQDLSFRWQRLRHKLLECNLYVSRNSLWWRPWVYPLQENDHYARSTQRIYTSATIGDPADLARRLGTKPIVKLDLDTALADQTLGRRLIVLDGDDDQPRALAAFDAAMGAQPKSVWMAASRASAKDASELVAARLQHLGLPPAPSWTVTPTGDEIDQFKRAQAGHLYCAGRYDGMDFDGGQARLFAVPDLPRATNPQEEFASAVLADATFLVERLNARIVQALGRGNRAPEDFAVYVLGDARFLQHFSSDATRRRLPESINAEIDLAQDHAPNDPSTVHDRVALFLGANFSAFDADLAEAQHGGLGPPEPPPPWSATMAAHEVEGWRALWVGDYPRAEREFERWAGLCDEHGVRELGGFARWCQAKAAFLSGLQGDAVAERRATEVLSAAIRQGGRHSAWFNRIRASVHRIDAALAPDPQPDEAREQILRAFDQLLLSRGDSAAKLERLRNATFEDLRAGSHARFQQALERMGELLGYRTVRPRGQAATDCRWIGSFAGVRELLALECKIEHEPANEITAGMVDQALGQVAAAATEWQPRGFAPRGAIVTHLENVAPEALARLGTLALVRADAIEALWERITELLAAFREPWSVDDGIARRRAADTIAGRLPSTGWLSRALDRGEPWVTAEALLSEWP